VSAQEHSLAALDSHKRADIRVSGRNPVDVADDVADRIAKGNNPPRLFQVSDDAAAQLTNSGTLRPLSPDHWLAYVARRANFTITTKEGHTKPIAPPAAVMRIVPPVVIEGLPGLNGIVHAPYLDQDGQVVAEDGYHPGTKLVLMTQGLTLRPVPDVPSQEDMAEARRLLTVEWLGDFPFASQADLSHAVALPLTLTGRPLFGLAPMFVVDASTSGSGKGLLVATANLITTGEEPHLLQLPGDSEEQRKQITTALLAGHDPIVWDESHVISGRALARIMTAGVYSDRILGGNKMLTVENRFTQVALGNNVQVHGDMRRRVVPCRMVPAEEHPEYRDDFRHPDLPAWVLEHRGELLWAVLVVWRNWIAQGRPKGSATMGSFSQWAAAIGGALEAAGIPGFLGNVTGWVDDSSEETSEWEGHLALLAEKFGGVSFTVHDAVARFTRDGEYIPSLPYKPELSLTDKLGYKYRGLKDRWLGDYRLVKIGEAHRGRARWVIETRSASISNRPDTSSPWSPWSPNWANAPEGGDHGDHGGHLPGRLDIGVTPPAVTESNGHAPGKPALACPVHQARRGFHSGCPACKALNSPAEPEPTRQQPSVPVSLDEYRRRATMEGMPV
jgi:hypothetical protein